MQRLKVSGAVRPIYESLGVKRLIGLQSLPLGHIYQDKIWRDVSHSGNARNKRDVTLQCRCR